MSGCSDRAERLEQERSPGAKGGGTKHRTPLKKPPSGLPTGSLSWREAHFAQNRPQAARSLRRHGRARSLAACSASSSESPARFGHIRTEAT
jgi:hypothetical protein